MEEKVSNREPLVNYLLENLKIEDFENLSKPIVIKKISDLLSGKELMVVANHNSHNYPVGSKYIMKSDFLSRRITVDYKHSSSAFKLLKVNFVGLYPDGNNIMADDMVILSNISVGDYITGLRLLHDVITYELDFLTSYKGEDRTKLLSKALTDIITNPISLPNHIELKNVINLYEEELKAHKEKQEKYFTLANSRIFISK